MRKQLQKCRNITIITYLQKNNQKEEKSPPTKLKTSHSNLIYDTKATALEDESLLAVALLCLITVRVAKVKTNNLKNKN